MTHYPEIEDGWTPWRKEKPSTFPVIVDIVSGFFDGGTGGEFSHAYYHTMTNPYDMPWERSTVEVRLNHPRRYSDEPIQFIPFSWRKL
jgi:hypothetical protein